MHPYHLNGNARALAGDGRRPVEPCPARDLARRELARVRALADAALAALDGAGERQAMAVSIEAARAAKTLYDLGRFIPLVDPAAR
jgi:hypothetical protein